jgi:hypothetical protein
MFLVTTIDGDNLVGIGQRVLEAINRKEYFFLNNQSDAPIIQIYSVINLYMFRATSLPIIKCFLLYIQQW